MLLLSLIGGCFMVAVGFLAARIATGFTRDVRKAQFEKVEKFSMQEFNRFSTASLITRSTNDLQQIQQVTAMVLRMSLMAPIMGIWAIYKAYQLAPSMTWIMAIAIITLILVIAVVFRFALPGFRKIQTLVDNLNLVTREILAGSRVIRAFNKQEFEEKRFDKVNLELTSVNLFVNRLTALLQPSMMLILNLTSVAIVWFGAHLVDDGSLLVGNMMAFMQYAMQAIFAFLMISIVFIFVPRAAVSANRVAEVLQTEIAISDPLVPAEVDESAPKSLVFDDVTFAFPGAEEPVLKHISFEAKPGETTAIIGSTGSGKSTLVNLIPRFYDATDGIVKVNGVDVRDLRLEDLYDKIGYVPQKSTLFSGTVDSNLRYGSPDSSAEEIEEVAQIAQASEFIEKLDGRYEALISQGATNLSGGQKQRLSIARALARHPEILIFDDSLSALDYRTESKLRAALKNVNSDSIVMLVGQRISAIMHSDNILVMDNGEIACQGTHDQLMKDCEVYQEIARSQLSDEELAQSGAMILTEPIGELV
jgi:ATP-binding cassette, subfamily B, multidrug efflux pump